MRTIREHGPHVLSRRDRLLRPLLGKLVQTFVVLAGCAGAAGCAIPSTHPGEPTKLHRIGFLASAPPLPHHEEFREGMRESGYIEGRDVAIEHRFAYGQHDRLPSLARELVDLRVDVIVAADTPAIRAARDATSTIPIVMGVSGDPEASGFVESLARPGGNITGLSILAKDTSAKRLELLSELLPTANRIVVMMNPVNPVTASQLKEIQSAAHLRGVEIQAVHVVQPEEIDAAFAAVADAGIQALVVVGDPVFIGQPARVGELLTSYRLAAMVPPELIEDGGLIAYSPSIGDLLRRSAAYVTKILRGANAADLPVEQPTRFDLVLNLRTAQALGLTIPQSVLAQAVRMIS